MKNYLWCYFFGVLVVFYNLKWENFLQFEITDLCINSLLKFIPLSLAFFQKELNKMSDLNSSIDELDFNQSNNIFSGKLRRIL